MTRTTNKKYIGLVSLAVVAIMATTLSIGIGFGVGAQQADSPNNLSRVRANQCGLEDGVDCTPGDLFLVNPVTNLTTSEDATLRGEGDNNDLNVSRPGETLLPTATPPPADDLFDLDGDRFNQNITYVGDDGALFATYQQREENEAGTGLEDPTNIIRRGSDRVLIFVADRDQVERRQVVVNFGTQTAGNAVGLTYDDMATLGSGMFDRGNLPIVDAQGLDGRLSESQRLQNDVSIYLDDGVRATANDNGPVIAADNGEFDFVEDAPAAENDTFIGNPSAVVQTRNDDGDVIAVQFTVSINDQQINNNILLVWQTPGENNNAIVQVAGGDNAAPAFVRLPETERGSGLFVGELEFVSPTELTNNTYEAAISPSETVTVNAGLVEITVPTVTTRADLNVYVSRETPAADTSVTHSVYNGARRLVYPVRPSSTVRVTYADKTSHGSGNSGTGVYANRIAEAQIDVEAPEVRITAPVNNFAIGERTPTFTGTASDGSTGSGLDTASLRLVIGNSPTNGDDISAQFDITQGYLNALPDETTVGSEDVRIAAGNTGDNGLYEDDPTGDIIRQVNWRYEPTGSGGVNRRLLSDANTAENGGLEADLAYQALVTDLAGNVSRSDAIDDVDGEPTTQGPQAAIITLDFRAPGLVNPSASNLTLIQGFTGVSRNVRILGASQSGVTWNEGQLRLTTSPNTILALFDDIVVDVDREDFTVDYEDSALDDPMVESVIQPEGFNADTFTDVLDSELDRSRLNELLQRAVFLVLDENIPPTGDVTIRVQNVEDRAGNEIDGDRDEYDLLDGRGPIVDVEFSGGSGSGSDTDLNGPATLTNDDLIVTIDSDEDAVRPEVRVLYERPGTGNNASTFTTAGTFNARRQTGTADDEFRWNVNIGSRLQPQGTGDDRLTRLTYCVVVTVTDNNGNPTTSGSSTCSLASFRFIYDGAGPELDTTRLQFDPSLSAATLPVGNRNVAVAGSILRNDQRPTIQIPLTEVVRRESVMVMLDGVEVPDDMVQTSDNRVFVYAPPEDLTLGNHVLQWEATDLAGNESDGAFGVVIRERTNFVLALSAGWNLVSFPSAPTAATVNEVFGNENITRVQTFDAADRRNVGMRVANRSASTGNLSGSLTTVRSGSAYWVFSESFTNVDVALTPPVSQSADGTTPTPTAINTVPGLNFVGVVDQSNQQTQAGDAGDALQSNTAAGTSVNVTLGNYLDGVEFSRAYTYDTNNSRFVTLDSNTALTVGQGLLVFITADANGRTNPIFP